MSHCNQGSVGELIRPQVPQPLEDLEHVPLECKSLKCFISLFPNDLYLKRVKSVSVYLLVKKMDGETLVQVVQRGGR